MDRPANATKWTPHALEEVAALLSAEQTEFTPDERVKFARVKIPVKKVRCHRSEEHRDDWLFVVADDGATAIVFDDVGQEFGICRSSELGEDIVRRWSLAGSLVFALMHLK
jgi:hypothetical protein